MNTIDDVIDRFDTIIDRARAARDRVGYFAALYRRMTLAVRTELRTGGFDDEARMENLDVVFAARYFDALDAYRDGKQLSECWRVTFDACADPKPTILQHLYAGLAAHLLLDLGIAAEVAAPGPSLPGLRGDFEHVNSVEGGLMRSFDAVIGKVSPWIGLLDRTFGVQYASFNRLGIYLAREVAWRTAVDLAAIPMDDEAKRGALIAKLDQRAAWLARSTLRPGALPGLVARAIRARESNDVAAVIDVLRGTEPSR